MINIVPKVKSVCPGAAFGVLVVNGLTSQSERSAMDSIITAEIAQIKSRYPDYERKAALSADPLCHYATYYKKFKKSYHVLGQLESVLLNGKTIPPVGVPVEAMFLAEIKNLLLSAGHDLDLIAGELTVGIATEPLSYQGITGKEQQLVQHDLYLSDEKGIISSIMSGPDYRTRITDTTKNALYFVYGVPGVEEPLIRAHLKTIFEYLSQAIPSAVIQSLEVL